MSLILYKETLLRQIIFTLVLNYVENFIRSEDEAVKQR